MELYTAAYSSASFRVRIALNLKGLPYGARAVNLGKGEHLGPQYGAVNPQGLVPALRTDGALLTQSIAIMEYLEETQPEPPLLPRDALGRARVRSLSLLVACEIHPLNNLRARQYLKNVLQLPEQAQTDWYCHWIRDGLAKLEAELAEGASAGKFCHGDRPTMADCCLVPQIFNARRFRCDTAHAPTVMRVFDQCMKLDAFDRAQPARQPDVD